MKHLSETEKQQLSQAINDIEKNTDGEFIAVIARESDDYLYIPILCAALISMLVSGVLVWANTAESGAFIYSVQVIVFLGLTVLFRFPMLKLALIPREVKQHRASRKAHELFFLEGLHLTEGRHGIMLFVSVAEKYVEVIADQGISGRVEQAVWDNVVLRFSECLKQGRVYEGYRLAISECGDVLARHCPAKNREKNEIPNHLIEL